MSAETMNDAEFGFGSGHINPVKAIDPGLVYDAREADYVAFLCGQGYTDPDLQIITGDASTCSSVTAGADTNLNYPSFALRTLPLASVDSSFIRTVTNVGSSVSTYKATIYAPSSGLKIQVNPSVLSFASQGQQLSFTLAIQGTMDASAIRAALVWDDGTHQVRSPIVVYI
ncbi:Subtilisin-like protease, fibronectin type-III domain [Dillenia turbinata]|uniref:Subtilisin-like protease, fibronectin type-III domain n=1 Tax=Dillenia turbinata TaxID=194707 RepID=A0AAN8VKJ2_9MAGN